MTARVLSLVLACLALSFFLPAAAARSSQVPEIAYVDEEDEAKAAEQLAKLLKKYDSPRDAERLVDILRKKRRYPGSPGAETLEYLCADGKTRQFTVLPPNRYSPRRPAGILVWLHGAISQPAPGGGAGEARMFSPAVRDLNLVVIGPSTYDRVEWGEPACRALVRQAVQHAKRQYNIDDDRVFLAGDSDGGRGTYAILETEASMFAAAVPVIGSPGGVTRFANLKNIPLLAINGETDTLFVIDRVRQAVEGMKAAGIDIDFREIAGKGHDPRLFLEMDEEVQGFLGKHPRNPFPATVHWSIDPSRGEEASATPANTFRWIRIEEAGAAESNTTFEDAGKGVLRASLPRIEATRTGNRIEVHTRGILRYSLLLATEMIDFKKPVELWTNGKKSFEGPVEADPRVVLEEARRTRDRSLLFSARITVDVDGELK